MRLISEAREKGNEIVGKSIVKKKSYFYNKLSISLFIAAYAAGGSELPNTHRKRRKRRKWADQEE